MKSFAFERPEEAIDAMAARLAPVETESVPAGTNLRGRVLGESVLADRDSPAADVSAMDGYALSELTMQTCRENPGGSLPVIAESLPGSPPPTVQASSLAVGVVRIFTGAIVPAACDRVIMREQTRETSGTSTAGATPLGCIELSAAAMEHSAGLNIRRRGENLPRGGVAIPAGDRIHAPSLAVLATFSPDSVSLFRPVRVAVLTTGDELVEPFSTTPEGQPLPPWRLRNSNAVVIEALLAGRSDVVVTRLPHVADDPRELANRLGSAVADHDLVILTGGVSAGDHDYVPKVVAEVGGEILFHKLPLRPGKPILGAVLARSNQRPRAILGLPGNPVSATINTVRFARPLIDRLAGAARWRPRPEYATVINPGEAKLPLVWMRPVRRLAHEDGAVGYVELLESRGSGDLVSLAASDGFIEISPGRCGPGPWPIYLWS